MAVQNLHLIDSFTADAAVAKLRELTPIASTDRDNSKINQQGQKLNAYVNSQWSQILVIGGRLASPTLVVATCAPLTKCQFHTARSPRNDAEKENKKEGFMVEFYNLTITSAVRVGC